MAKVPIKVGREWAYFGEASRWENISKPKELASLPRCLICKLAVKIERRTNIYCWNCWKICIRPDEEQQYESLVNYFLRKASENPSFHGKYFIGYGRPVVVVRVGSEEERDAIFSQILEELKELGLYPKDSKKRWYRRGCDSFDSILGKWKSWKEPTMLSEQTIKKILQLTQIKRMPKFIEW